MIQLINKFLKNHKIGLVLVSSSLLLYNWFLVAFFPTIKKIDFNKIIKQYPKEFLAFFGGTKLPINSFEGFVNVEFYSLMLIIIAAGFLITLSSAEFTKEFESGTIEILLSLPISRGKIYLTKWLNIMGTALLAAMLGVLGTAAFGRLYGISLSLKAFYTTAILTILFFWVIASFAILMSVIFNERSKPIIISIALLSIGYIINSLANIIERVKSFQFLSVFYYYDTAKALGDKEISLTSLVVFLSIIIISSVLGYLWFYRRDFAS